MKRNGSVISIAPAFVALLLFLQILVFLIFRDRSYLQFHDNLDLFVAHYKMMSRQHAWFAHGVELPVLHGVNRDLFGSEFLLYNVLYILLPTVPAYLLGYFLKIAVGMFSFLLLARDFAGSADDGGRAETSRAAGKERFRRLLPVLLPVAAAFGMIPVFPTYGIAFTSVPLVIWILRRIWFRQGLTSLQAPSAADRADVSGKQPAAAVRILPYVALFFYPLLSYFSYHGFFILGYMTVALVILWIRGEGTAPRKRRFPLRMLIAILVLSAGYVVFEYRLFGAMLLDHTVTIRTTMEHGELTLIQALQTAFSEFFIASFHSQDSHTYLVLPVVLIGALVSIIWHLRGTSESARRDAGGSVAGTPNDGLSDPARPAGASARGSLRAVLTDPLVLLLFWIFLSCLNFGLYQYAPYRHLLEALMPPLTGFEFARTAYFNTFLWYAAFAVVLARLAESGIGQSESGIGQSESGIGQPENRIGQSESGPDGTSEGRHSAARMRIASGLACLAAVIVMFVPQVYNDFYYTVYNHAYILLKHRETSRVNVREYYSEELFARILDDMDYQGEWSCAYGMHPAILNYNGIASLDGYLGMYAQSYKDTWERVEAPAFAGSPWIRDYFTGWGARVCLYSGSDENTYEAFRYPEIEDKRLVVDLDELRALDCRYIFSRIQFSNADELGLRTVGVWDGADPAVGAKERSPYVITVYELPGWGGTS